MYGSLVNHICTFMCYSFMFVSICGGSWLKNQIYLVIYRCVICMYIDKSCIFCTMYVYQKLFP